MIFGVLILCPAAHNISKSYKILCPFFDLKIRKTVITAKNIFTLRIISAEMRLPRTHCRKMGKMFSGRSNHAVAVSHFAQKPVRFFRIMISDGRVLFVAVGER